MTAPADLAAVRAALALVAQATPGPWATDPDGDLVGPDASVRHPNGTTGNLVACLFAEHDTAAIVALRNAAPAIAAAVAELERLRADNKAFAREREIAMKLGGKINALRELADEAIGTASEAPDGGDQVADYRERLAVLNRQVCRLVSGQEIDGDLLCQHHGAEAAALAQVARYQVAAVAVATEIGGSLGPVDDDPEERAAAFVRFAESLAGRVAKAMAEAEEHGRWKGRDDLDAELRMAVTRANSAERELSAERRGPPAPLREALAKYEASVAAWAKGTPGSRLDEAVAMEFHRAAVVSALATAEAAAEQRGMSAAQGKGTDDE